MRSGSVWKWSSTSWRAAWLTAITASAWFMASRSTQADSSYPPPSCSRFQGRSGSREWTVTTRGTFAACAMTTPPRWVYQVWQWTRSASIGSAAMARLRLKAPRTGRRVSGAASRSMETG